MDSSLSQKRISELYSSLNDKDKKISLLKSENSCLKKEINHTQETVSKLQEDVFKIQQSGQNNRQKLEQENSRMSQKCEYLRKDLELTHGKHQEEIGIVGCQLKDAQEKLEGVGGLEQENRKQIEFFGEKVVKKRKKIQILKEENEKSTKEIYNLRKNISDREGENTKLGEKLAKNKNKYESDQKKQMSTIQDISTEYDKVKQNTSETVIKLQTEVKIKDEEIVSTRKKLGSLEQELSNLQQETKLFEDERNYYERLHSEATQKITELTFECPLPTFSKGVQTDQIGSLELLLHDSKAKLAQLYDSILRKDIKINELNESKLNLEKEREDSEGDALRLKGELEEIKGNNEKEKLESEEATTELLDKLDIAQKECEIAHNYGNERANQLKAENDRILKESMKFKQSNNEIKGQLEHAQEALQLLESEKTYYENLHKDLSSKITDIGKKHSAFIKEKNTEIEKLLHRQKVLENVASEHGHKINEQNEIINELENQKKESQTEIEKIAHEKDKLSNSSTNLATNYSELEKRNKILKEELQSGEAENDDITQKLKVVKERLEETEALMDTKIRDNCKLADRIKVIEQNIEEKDSKMGEMNNLQTICLVQKEKIDELEIVQEAKEQELKDLEIEKNSEIFNLEHNIKGLKEEINSISQVLEQQNDILGIQENNEEKIQEKEEELSALNGELGILKEKNNEYVDKVKQQVEINIQLKKRHQKQIDYINDEVRIIFIYIFNIIL